MFLRSDGPAETTTAALETSPVGAATPASVIDEPAIVDIEGKADESFGSLVLNQAGLKALVAHDNAIKVKVTNLSPRTTYYYRFVYDSIYDIAPENAMAFHPRYWNQAVRNGSAEYNYYEWNKVSRATAAQHIKLSGCSEPQEGVLIGSRVPGSEQSAPARC